MKRSILVIMILFYFIKVTGAQSVEKTLQAGNEYFRQSEFDLAEAQYRKALKHTPADATVQFNLADALYRQKKYDEATGIFTKLSTASNKNMKDLSYYNAGVIYSKEKDLPSSIDAYKNALRNNPDDMQARENLQKAMLELRKQQQQNKSNQQSAPNISQHQAEQKLKQLEQREKQLQERLQGQNAKNSSQAQDW